VQALRGFESHPLRTLFVRVAVDNGTIYRQYAGMRDTQRKGDIAVSQAIATFTRMGYDVLIPLTESAAYDLVIDVGDSLKRVQVRFSSTGEVDLRRVHSNSKGYVVKKAISNSYDWLYVLGPNGQEFLIKECLVGRRSVNPSTAYVIDLTYLKN
jgi:hypothetical protein